MQSSADAIVDKKIQIIYDNYRDNIYARNAQKEVQATRRNALYTGAGISTLAFVSNEVARLSMKSRKLFANLYLIIHFVNLDLFKLNVVNVAFWLVAPTFICK